MNQEWSNLDGNGHYWPAQTPGPPPSYYPTPSDPLVSPDFSGWCSRGAALVKRVWKPALIVHALVAVPTVALNMPAQAYLLAEQEALDLGSDELPPLGDLMLAVLIIVMVALFTSALFLIATSATVQLVVQAATGRPVSLGAALTTALRRTPALLGWGVLALLLSIVAFVLCFLPVIYVGAVLAVLPVVVTLERGAGIGRCFEIFHADFGASVSRIVTILGITVGAGLAVGVVALAVEAGLGTTAGTVVDALLSGALTLAFGVLATPFLVTAYADMRSRREPFSTAYLMPG